MPVAWRFHSGFAVGLGLLSLFFAACGGRPAPGDLNAIQHIVFIVKENRTFDTYFGTFPGANGATSGRISTGQVVALSPMPDRFPSAETFCNGWDCAIEAMDGGNMDKFDMISGGTLNAYTQASERDIPNYWAYARQFVLADQYFTSMHGPSFPNYLFALAAQSDGVISNPFPPATCGGDPTSTVSVIDKDGNITNQFPCFDFPTLADSLQAAGITWKFYAAGPGGVLGAIRHLRYSVLWNEHTALDLQFISDAQNGQLPAVSWLFPPFDESEHAPASVCEGENWTVRQVNAVMQGPDWNSTVLFITWDDFGGLYDHVPAPQIDQFGLGPRVPLLIVSPFAKAGYISHTVYEHSSILKFIETRYQLQPLAARDGMASDMLDSFEFNQQQPPLVLQPRPCP